MSNNYFDDLTERVDQVAVARLDMGHNENVVEKWGAGIKQHISHTRVFAESYAPELSVDNAEIARLEQALKVARSEAIQARAQAAMVTAERDTLRQELEAAHQSRGRLVSAYRILRPCLKEQARYDFEWENLKADAREMAQALKQVYSLTHDADKRYYDIGGESMGTKIKNVLTVHGARYLEQP